MGNLGDKFLEVAGRIGSQRHMVAIRDSFATLMPLLIAGSLAVLINGFPIGGGAGQSLATILPPAIVSINGAVWQGTFGMLTYYLVAMLSYNLAKSYDAERLGAVVVGLGSYIAITPWGEYTGSTGLLMGMVIAIASTEIFVRLFKVKQLVIKMPAGVPPAVARSFASLIPGVVTLFAISTVCVLFETIAGANIHVVISNAIVAPLQHLTNTLGAALLIVFLVHFMWAVGLHGPNILEGPIQLLFMDSIVKNGEVFQATGDAFAAPFIITKQFLDAFVYIGGSGASLGLIIAIYMVGKAKSIRAVANVAAPAGLFNINEPVIFGMPIILNPIFAIPFIVSPLVLTVISYFAVSMNIVAKTVLLTHWTVPPIISGYLTTGGHISGSILQIVNLAISVAIYIPFVIIANKQEMKKEQEAAQV